MRGKRVLALLLVCLLLFSSGSTAAYVVEGSENSAQETALQTQDIQTAEETQGDALTDPVKDDSSDSTEQETAGTGSESSDEGETGDTDPTISVTPSVTPEVTPEASEDNTENSGTEESGNEVPSDESSKTEDATPVTPEVTPGTGTEEDSVTELPETETGETSGTAVIYNWTWVDEEGLLQQQDGVWGIGVPGASQAEPLTQEKLQELLPKQITAQVQRTAAVDDMTDGSAWNAEDSAVMSGETENTVTETETLDLSWDLSVIPVEGVWTGDYEVCAQLPEGYSLGEDVGELKVVVQVGGMETYASEENLNANKLEGVSPKGTTINVFDYWLTHQDDRDQSNPDDYGNKGINNGHVLKFGTNMGTDYNTSNLTSSSVNYWTGSNAVRSGIVSSTLTEGYPTLSGQLGNGSLAYLFDPSVSHEGKASYSDATGLLQVEKDTGYFYYNSQSNFAELNRDTKAFTLYNTWAVYAGGKSPDGQFFPFNTGAQVFEDFGYNQISQKDLNSISQINGTHWDSEVNINHYFGLTMTTRFVQQYGGYTDENGEKVTYEFSGDDDVWVFIDDVLVADLGGIHDAASLSIDFSTGVITINGNYAGTLREKYVGAGKGNSTSWRENTFADNTYHKLNFFYLERGNTDSNMRLKFNMVTIPESGIIKVDQAGNHIAGAGFALYATDENYEVAEGAQAICSGTTDENGELIFVDDTGQIVSLNDLYSKKIRYMVLRETHTPSGYRNAGDMHLRFHTSKNGDVVLLSSNEWDTGSYASSKVTTQTGAEITAANTGNKANLDDGGTLFAVVLQKQEGNNWKAVYGDPENGWHVSQQQEVLSGVLEAARYNPYEFHITASGAYEVEVENLPGDITSYYYMLAGEDQDAAKYTVGYYYTSASSVENATTENTWLVNSESFERVFSVNLYVANIQNNLYVQKLDEAGNPVSAAAGTATFSLYNRSDVTISGDGSYTITQNAKPIMTQTTSDMSSPFPLVGGAMFSRIPNGQYYLIETTAPPGYALNATAVPVVVDRSGVYADAGSSADAISVRRGVGSVVRSMLQFATDDDIDATLHGIKVSLYTASGNFGEELTWGKNGGEELHLQFDNQNKVLEYGPITSEGVSFFEVEEGWSKLEIHQCLDQHGELVSSPKQDLSANEGDPDLVNLYSGTVTVCVKDQKVGNLKIRKTVTGENIPEETQFTFTLSLTEPQKEGESQESPLEGTYTGNVYNSAGQLTGVSVTVENGTATVLLERDQYILFENLPAGTGYTVTESPIPPGFTPSVSVNNSPGEKGSVGTGTIQFSVTDEVLFTNAYSKSVTLTGETALKGQKTLQGRELTQKDSFEFTLSPADDSTQNALGTSITFAKGYDHSSITGDGSSNKAEFTFGDLTFTEAGTFTFAITEKLPQGVNGENPTADGITYDVHTAVVEIQVSENPETGLLEAVVSYSNDGAVTETDKQMTDRAAFTNQIVADFSFIKTDRDGMDGKKLSGATFAMYRLICSDSTHEHQKNLIQVANADTGEISASDPYAGCWKLAEVVISDNDGKVSFSGLPIDSEYRLVELKAPGGFTLPKGQWRIVYNPETQTFGPAQTNSAVERPTAIGIEDSEYYIINYKPGELPFTGNTGIKIFLIIGGVLMAVGVIGILEYRKRWYRLH